MSAKAAPKPRPQLHDPVSYRFDPSGGIDQPFAHSDWGALGGRVVRPGDSTPVASYPTVDLIVMVKRGRVDVIAENGTVMAELGTLDGIVLPAGTAFRLAAPADGSDETQVLEFHAARQQIDNSHRPFGV